MSTETTLLDLAAITARTEAATDGPWYPGGGDMTLVFGATPGQEVAQARRRPDSEFIRHARTDVPALVAEVKSLRREVDRLDRALGQVIDERDRMHDVADRLAYSIAPMEVIGEHSSGNDPWANALDIQTQESSDD